MQILNKILIVLTLAIGASAQAPVPNVPPKTTRAVHLAWDASITPGVTYVLRRGNASGQYVEMVELPTGTLSYTWTNTPSGSVSYFVLTAKLSGVTNGVPWMDESAYSNEVKSEPRSVVQPPVLMMAVPITVEIFRGKPGGQQAKVLTLGPFLDMADMKSEVYSAAVLIGKPKPLLPE